ncbi:hypothetical protein PCANC_06579 [Puccinia coronata f. sp. avenae]|uniref:Acetyl-coenzyme A carboxylase carboxyl transferase subunit beta domain-containing protein n=1 Tax=Puccinia coronata f. sp. avenae TaxID=200324 RepID=A0A2N5U686_9BASI|nr:hypothetical protein PCASD_09508 [Puccinia coronata f. sp. avenae]PLW46864.1 hypothetical protein PCANC_06579 [Puccinia coronata f. sp. avenae]
MRPQANLFGLPDKTFPLLTLENNIAQNSCNYRLGVESLRGSGLIVGDTSCAYNNIFTINLVTVQLVGIGAYLVRLGQRAVQVEGQLIILTGAGALNEFLGREVSSSNLPIDHVHVRGSYDPRWFLACKREMTEDAGTVEQVIPADLAISSLVEQYTLEAGQSFFAGLITQRIPQNRPGYQSKI